VQFQTAFEIRCTVSRSQAVLFNFVYLLCC